MPDENSFPLGFGSMSPNGGDSSSTNGNGTVLGLNQLQSVIGQFEAAVNKLTSIYNQQSSGISQTGAPGLPAPGSWGGTPNGGAGSSAGVGGGMGGNGGYMPGPGGFSFGSFANSGLGQQLAGLGGGRVGGALTAISGLQAYGNAQLQGQFTMSNFVQQMMLGSYGTGSQKTIQQSAFGQGALPNIVGTGISDLAAGYAQQSYFNGYSQSPQNGSPLARSIFGASMGFGAANPGIGFQNASNLATQMYSPAFNTNMMMSGMTTTPFVMGGGTRGPGQVYSGMMQSLFGKSVVSPQLFNSQFNNPRMGAAMTAAAQGWSPQMIQSMREQNLIMYGAQKQGKAITPTEAQQLMTESQGGNKNANPSTIAAAQQKISSLTGGAIKPTDVQRTLEYNATKTSRASDIADAFNAGLATSVSGLTKLNMILNKIAQSPAGQALGYGSGFMAGTSMAHPGVGGMLGSGLKQLLTGGGDILGAVAAKKILGSIFSRGGSAAAGAGDAAAAGAEADPVTAAIAALGGPSAGGGAAGGGGLLATGGAAGAGIGAGLGLAAFGVGSVINHVEGTAVGKLMGGLGWGSQYQKHMQSLNHAARGPQWLKDVSRYTWDPAFSAVATGLDHLANGGVTPGYSPGVDSRFAFVSPGEGHLIPEAVAGMGGKKAIDKINQHYKGYRGKSGKSGKSGKPGSNGVGVSVNSNNNVLTQMTDLTQSGAGGSMVSGLGSNSMLNSILWGGASPQSHLAMMMEQGLSSMGAPAAAPPLPPQFADGAPAAAPPLPPQFADGGVTPGGMSSSFSYMRPPSVQAKPMTNQIILKFDKGAIEIKSALNSEPAVQRASREFVNGIEKELRSRDLLAKVTAGDN